MSDDNKRNKMDDANKDAKEIRTAQTRGFLQNCEYVKQFFTSIEASGPGDFTEEEMHGVKDMMVSLGKLMDMKPKGLEKKEKRRSSRVSAKGSRSNKETEETTDEYDSDEETTDTEEEDEDEEERVSRKLERLKKLNEDDRKSAKGNRNKSRRSSLRDLTLNDVGRCIDFRQAPKLEKFSVDSGKDLKEYLAKFEDYCEQNVRGGEGFWPDMLEEKLEGNLLQRYKLRDHDEDYWVSKRKLLKWWKDNGRIRTRSSKKKFRAARPKKGESLYFFSMRLESLYKVAYPKLTDKKKPKLLRQFKKVIPKSARTIIETQLMFYDLRGKQPVWEFFQDCIKLKDLYNEEYSDSDSEEESKQKKEIDINLGQRDGEFLASDSRSYGSYTPRRGAGHRDHQVRRERTFSRGNSSWSGNVSADNRAQGATAEQRGPKEGARTVFEANQNAHSSTGGDNNDRIICWHCGESDHMARNCRWKLGLCLACGGKGHFSADCPNNRWVDRSGARGGWSRQNRGGFNHRGGFSDRGQRRGGRGFQRGRAHERRRSTGEQVSNLPVSGANGTPVASQVSMNYASQEGNGSQLRPEASEFVSSNVDLN